MKKNEKRNMVEIVGLVLDRNNNFYMEIKEGKEFDYIPTHNNIRDIFKQAIVQILKDFEVDFTTKEIEYFLEVLIHSNEHGLPTIELYRRLIDSEVDEYLKIKFDTKSSKRHLGKIDKIILENFLGTDFKRIAINYISLYENMFFIKYYAVILDKPIILRKNGKTIVVTRVPKM